MEELDEASTGSNSSSQNTEERNPGMAKKKQRGRREGMTNALFSEEKKLVRTPDVLQTLRFLRQKKKKKNYPDSGDLKRRTWETARLQSRYGITGKKGGGLRGGCCFERGVCSRGGRGTGRPTAWRTRQFWWPDPGKTPRRT